MNKAVKSPKVSVCVITYNQEKYIRECLQSIVDQETNFDFEVIIGDDCSTDKTREIIGEFEKKYPQIIKPIYQAKNIDGGNYNFLSVHRMAIGQYIAQIDGDDLMLPGKLNQQAHFLDNNPDCNVVWHKMNYFDDVGNKYPGQLIDYSIFNNGTVVISDVLRLGSVTVSSSTMYRKKSRKTTHPKFITLDLFYTIEYLSTGWGKILNEVLGEYRINATGSISKNKKNKMKRLVYEHMMYFLNKFPENKKDIFLFAILNLLIDIKWMRRTAFYYLILALKSFTIISIEDIKENIKKYKKLALPKINA